MNRPIPILLAASLLLLGGCAADSGSESGAALRVVGGHSIGIDEPEYVSIEPAPLEGPTVALSLSARDAITGEVLAEADVCRVGFEAPRGFAMGGFHAPDPPRVDGAMECRPAGDDGSMVTEVFEHTEVLLAAYAPGYPFYVTHMTSGQDDSRAELSLLGDADLDRLHDELGVERELDASAIVVETPVAGLRVSLVPLALDPGHRALSPDAYLDARGQRVAAAVDGGKALFVNVAQNVYEARLEHDYVRCSPAGSHGWDMPQGSMVWALHGLEAYLGGIACQL